MDLADRGSGEGALVELREHAVRERRAELLSQQLLHAREGHRRNPVAEGREFSLELVLLVVVETVELDHRDHLTDLHRRAAHPPQLIDELVHERRRSLLLGSRCALGRTDAIGRTHAGPANALPSHQPADARRPRQPTSRQALCVWWQIFGGHAHDRSVPAPDPAPG